MDWKIVYTKEAEKDLEELDNSQRLPVLKAIKNKSANPLPKSEGGYGKPLGNHVSTKLAGFLKITLRDFGLRIVYTIVRDKKVMQIIIISIRDDETVYKLVQARIKK